MNPLGIGIAWFMIAVMVVALDLALGTDVFLVETRFTRFVLLGTLPITNLLAMAGLVSGRVLVLAGFVAWGLAVIPSKAS